MKAVTAEEMRNIDRVAIEEYGIPAEVLMGFAGREVAARVMKIIPPGARVEIYCGAGNNGGDGFIVAYLLLNAGYRPRVRLAGERGKMSGTSRVYLGLCEKAGVPVLDFESGVELADAGTEKPALIVDALLGTGVTGAPRGVVAEAIAAINGAGVPVLAIDMPSGLPSDGEAPAGEAVRADHTVTIGLPKIGLAVYPGREYAGEVVTADIGFPSALTGSDMLKAELADRLFVKKLLRLPGDIQDHKGARGHLLLAGGFDGMEGAIMMTAAAALATGVGLVTCLTTPEARKIIAGKIPELITREIPFDGKTGRDEKGVPLSPEAMDEWLASFLEGDRRYDALVIGPGLGRGAVSRGFYRALMKRIPASGIKKVLIDGDGLFHLAEGQDGPPPDDGIERVLTPHFGEASRLLGMTAGEIARNRVEAAKRLAEKTRSVAVLKGPATIVSDGTGLLINTTGNQGMATAGTGDVLAGMTGALLLRKGLSAYHAAGAGVYLHGLAADLAAGPAKVLKATDLTARIGDALETLCV